MHFAGTGILIRVDLNKEIKLTNLDDARIMGIELKINDFNIRVGNAQKESFYSFLTKATEKTQKHQKLIVFGDFLLI